jgi:hypothetical protein
MGNTAHSSPEIGATITFRVIEADISLSISLSCSWTRNMRAKNAGVQLVGHHIKFLLYTNMPIMWSVLAQTHR